MPDEKNSIDGDNRDDDADALVSRLRVIEDQPLNERAEAFGQLHEELRRGLEGSDSVA